MSDLLAVVACNHMGVYWSRGVLVLAAKVQSMSLLSGHNLLLVSRVVFAVICMQPGISNSLQRLLAIQICMPCCFRNLTRQSGTACICTAAALLRRVFKHLFALSCIVQDCSEGKPAGNCCCQARRQCTSCSGHSWFVKGWHVAGSVPCWLAVSCVPLACVPVTASSYGCCITARF
jgi:hypothetical protein